MAPRLASVDENDRVGLLTDRVEAAQGLLGEGPVGEELGAGAGGQRDVGATCGGEGAGKDLPRVAAWNPPQAGAGGSVGFAAQVGDDLEVDAALDGKSVEERLARSGGRVDLLQGDDRI